jgi:hypothetical protein
MWLYDAPEDVPQQSRRDCPPAEAESPRDEREFRVPVDRLAELVRGIEQLDRRGRRIGTGPVRLAVRHTGANFATVVVEGEQPTLVGWELTAVLEYRASPPTLHPVTAFGETLAAASFGQATCEHCGVRRRRIRTYLLRNTQGGALKQVGSGCLRDFLGGHDPAQLLAQAESLAAARATLRAVDTPEPAHDDSPSNLTTFAAYAAHVLRSHGWASRERARATGQPSTADRAAAAMARNEPIDDADRALALEAMTWAAAVLPTKAGLSPWEKQVIAAVSRGHALRTRERGLVCALVAVYRSGRPHSSHVGRVGEVIDVVVLVHRSTTQQSDRYGAVHRHELVDARLNRMVWWQTRGPALPAGGVAHLRGRVAKHTQFAGAAATVLSRCQVAALGPTSPARPI